MGKVKWAVGNLKLAQTQPPTVKYAKRYIKIWGALLCVVLLNASIGLLVGPMSWFMFGFTIVSLCVYAACLKWSVEGLSYATRQEQRREFNEIVAGLQNG